MRDLTSSILRLRQALGLSVALVVAGVRPIPAAEPLPREILVPYDAVAPAGILGPEYYAKAVQRLVEMPLNHLGLILRYHNVRDGLPEPATLAATRGVLVWFDQDILSTDPEAFLTWCETLADQGVRLVVIGNLPVDAAPGRPRVSPTRLQRFWSRIGLEWTDNSVDITYDVEAVLKNSPLVEFERPLPPSLPPFSILRIQDPGMESHLRLRRKSEPETTSDLVVTGRRGGYIAADFLGLQDRDGTYLQLQVNPFEFFRLAFGTDDLPKPDVTTLSGGRIYYSHIDGDGWRSETDVAGYKDRHASCAEVVFREVILPNPDLPVTVGPVAADIDPAWFGNRGELALAREIFAQSHVEAGTHTYTHPLEWAPLSGAGLPGEDTGVDQDDDGHPPPDDDKVGIFGSGTHITLPEETQNAGPGPRLHRPATGAGGPVRLIPRQPAAQVRRPTTYARGPFRLEREVGESIAFINRLCPPGKKVEVLQWSGNCCPFEAALEAVKAAGIRNINGGDSRFDTEFPSCAWVAPVGRRIGAFHQIFASNSNELTYTDLWTARFFAFRNLPDTVRNTGSPRRLSAFNHYFHMYSGERPSSLNALKSNLAFARTQELTPVSTSHYAGIADGFFSCRLVPDGPSAWWVEQRDRLQTLRFDQASGRELDRGACRGVLGSRRVNGSLYVALDESENRPRVALRAGTTDDRPDAPAQPGLVYSRWPVRNLEIGAQGWTCEASGFGSGVMRWSVPGSRALRVRIGRGGAEVSDERVAPENGILTIALPGNGGSPVRVTVDWPEGRP